MRGHVKKIAATGVSAVALSLLMGGAASATSNENHYGEPAQQYKYQAYQYPDTKEHATYKMASDNKDQEEFKKEHYQTSYKPETNKEASDYKKTDTTKHESEQKDRKQPHDEYAKKTSDHGYMDDKKDHKDTYRLDEHYGYRQDNDKYEYKDMNKKVVYKHSDHKKDERQKEHYHFKHSVNKPGNYKFIYYYKSGHNKDHDNQFVKHPYYKVKTASHHMQTEWQMKFDAPLREHAAVGVAALNAAHLNKPDKAALSALVDKNSHEIAKVVGQAYPGSHDEFLPLWQSHIEYYKDYLKAAEAKDEDGKKEAKKNLEEFTHKVTHLLVKTGHGVNKEELQRALAGHGHQVTKIVDYFVAGEYDHAWATAHHAYEHMGKIAKLLAEGAKTTHHSVHHM